MDMKKTEWVINGYDGTAIVFEKRLLGAALTDTTAGVLLQRLAVRNLDDDEIIDASLRAKAKGYRGLLEIRREAGGHRRGALTVGDQHLYFTAMKVIQR